MKAFWLKISDKKTRHLFILSFAGGVFASFAFPPTAFTSLFLVSLGMVYCLSCVIDCPKKNFWIGFAYSLGLFGASLYWIHYAMFVDLGRFWWLIPIGLFSIPAFISLYVGASFWLFVKVRKHFYPQLWPLLFSTLWCTFEWLRGHMFTGFPWNLIGYSLSDWLIALQGASLFGIYGLGLLLCFFITFIAHLIFLQKQRRVTDCLPPFLILMGLIIFGLWRLDQNPTAFHEVTVRLVQPNIPQKRRWNIHENDAIFQEQLILATKKSTRPVHLIILPEAAFSSIPYFLEQDIFRRRHIGHLLPKETLLITGASRFVVDSQGEAIFNSILVLDHFGNIVSSYDKSHLVPFGEYIPLRSFLESLLPAASIRKITAGDRDFSFGSGLKRLHLKDYPAPSPLICYEAIFPGKVVPQKSLRPQWLLNVTNDAWYGQSAGPYQHLQIARMRAIEEGLPLIRVANTGICAVFDGLGRELQALPLEQQGIIDSLLPKPLRTPPLYGQWGDLALVFLFMILWAFELARIRFFSVIPPGPELALKKGAE